MAQPRVYSPRGITPSEIPWRSPPPPVRSPGSPWLSSWAYWLAVGVPVVEWVARRIMEAA